MTWEAKHFIELLTDIQDAFLTQYDVSHGRKEVANYKHYFVGSIITASEEDGKKPIIDGQQRLTSLFVMMAFLERYRNDHNISDVQDLGPLLKRTNYGSVDYVIQFSTGRQKIFAEYLNFSIPLADALKNIDLFSDLDEGDQRIANALKIVNDQLNNEVKDNVAFFIDYLIKKVTLIEISVANENDAHRVFVTMNDRGLRLGPIDLLKGHILSRIRDRQDNKSCHEKWAQNVITLKEIDPEEDSLFFRDLLRARWAETIRDKKKKGEAPGDFESAGDAYHRWFVERAQALGYSTSDDYSRFARDEMTKYVGVYKFIRASESALDSTCEHVYFNAARKYTLQPMVLLAPINPDDQESVWRKKIALVSQLIDLILTSRTIDGLDNNYDSIKNLSFTLAKKLRGKGVSELSTLLQSEWATYLPSIARVSQLDYAKDAKSDILYVLARLASFLEQKLSLTNAVGFETYWSRDRNMKTFDIEHILCSDARDFATHGFSTEAEYKAERNRLGALVLLPRSRNRSLQDKPYSDKLTAYATENVLTSSLSAGFHANNPTVSALKQEYPELSDIDIFDKTALQRRATLYSKLAESIWRAPD